MLASRRFYAMDWIGITSSVFEWAVLQISCPTGWFSKPRLSWGADFLVRLSDFLKNKTPIPEKKISGNYQEPRVQVYVEPGKLCCFRVSKNGFETCLWLSFPIADNVDLWQSTAHWCLLWAASNPVKGHVSGDLWSGPAVDASQVFFESLQWKFCHLSTTIKDMWICMNVWYIWYMIWIDMNWYIYMRNIYIDWLIYYTHSDRVVSTGSN